MTDNRSIFSQIVLIAAALLVGPIASWNRVAAQETAGRRLAETWCSNCHVVSAEQHRGASTGAPTFTAIADMKSTTPMGLRVFLQTPHSAMPDLHLTRNETDDLIAYIMSLRRS